MRIPLLGPAIFCFGVASAFAQTPITAATGYSDDADLVKAATHALEQALKGMGQVKPKLVLLSENLGKENETEKALQVLDTFSEILPEVPVYGVGTLSENYSPITFHPGNTGQHACAVMTLGGDFEHEAQYVTGLPTTIWADPLRRPDEARVYRETLLKAGRDLAQKLQMKDAKLVLVLGGIHNPRQRFIIQGMEEALGSTAFPAVGGAGWDPGYIYFPDGVHSYSVMAIAMKGRFRVGQAGRRGGWRSVEVAGDMVSQAMHEGNVMKPALVFGFGCASWHHDVPSLLESLRTALGGEVPLWGHFAGGELGALRQGGNHIALSDLGFVCVIQGEPIPEVAPPRSQILLEAGKTVDVPDSFVKRWMIFGPFSCMSRLGWSSLMTEALDEPFIEQEPVLTPAVRSELEGVYWRPYACADDETPEKATLVDLAKIFTPSNYQVAYLYAELESPRNLDRVKFLMGSDDFIKVWLNGQLVHTYRADGRLIRWDDDKIEGLTLRQGCNRIVIKTTNLTGDWGVYLRLCDQDGNPLRVTPQ